jgi:hypothetical protein
MNFEELHLYAESLESRISRIKEILEAGDKGLLNAKTQLEFIEYAVKPRLKLLSQ